jgi:hypothetical protein
MNNSDKMNLDYVGLLDRKFHGLVKVLRVTEDEVIVGLWDGSWPYPLARMPAKTVPYFKFWTHQEPVGDVYKHLKNFVDTINDHYINIFGGAWTIANNEYDPRKLYLASQNKNRSKSKLS